MATEREKVSLEMDQGASELAIRLADAYLEETGLTAADALSAVQRWADHVQLGGDEAEWDSVEAPALRPGVPHLKAWLADRGEKSLGLFLAVLMRFAHLAGQERPRSVIRWGVAGYNATTRNRRMVEDAIRKHGIELTAKDSAHLRTWDPSILPLDARLVLLGCLHVLTDTGLMPNLPPDQPVRADQRIMVPLPGGYSQLADACGYERGSDGEYGRTHSRTVRDQMRRGLDNLVKEVRNMFHLWKDYDPKEKRQVWRYQHVRAAIAEEYTEGEAERHVDGTQRDLFLSPYAQYIALHPMALLGAKQRWGEIPGDFLSRYRHALATLAERGKTDPRVREIIGSKPRLTESDIEFLVWCYMHKGKAVRIDREKLMGRIGLDAYIEQRKKAKAEQMLARAEAIAREVGALEETADTDDQCTTYIMPGRPEDAPAGTLEMFEEE